MQRESIQESSDSALKNSIPTNKPQLSGLISLAALSACGGGQQNNSSSNNSGSGKNNLNQNSNQNQNQLTRDLAGFIVDNYSGSNGSQTGVSNGTNNTQNSEITPPTDKEAARFLMQASFGGTYEQIQTVQTKGFETWLDDELNRPWVQGNSHFNWFHEHGYMQAETLNLQSIGLDNSLWRKLMAAPDVLRQKVAYALSQIFVVSINGVGATIWRNLVVLTYMDLLEKNAFSNYKDLLRAITLSPAMGTYLNMAGSRKASGTSSPDENYAREVMQLFSIGLYELNDDGSLKKNASDQPIETYSQENVTQLAAIFTGWYYRSNNTPSYTALKYLQQPMVNNPAYFTAGD